VDKVLERFKNELKDEESRYTYADAVTDAFLTGQIKALREERGFTQEELAKLVGTQQSGISRWLNSGFSGCKVESLRKFARAYGVRLRISFEEFGTLPTDVEGFSKERLAPRRFEDDPVLNPTKVCEPEKAVATMAAAEKNLRELRGGELAADDLELLRQHLEGRARAGTLYCTQTIKPGQWNKLQPATGLLDPLPECFTRVLESIQRKGTDYVAANSHGGDLMGLASPPQQSAKPLPIDQSDQYKTKALASSQAENQIIKPAA